MPNGWDKESKSDTIKNKLKKIRKELASLAKQVEGLSKQANKMQPAKKATAAKKPAAKKAAKKKATAAKKIPAAKKAAKKKAPSTKKKTALNTVLDVINRSKKGVTVDQLKKRTNLDARQLSNALYKLSKKGQVYAKSRGLYVKK